MDIIPRIITAKEWDTLEKGIQQRILAVNAFLQDIYNEEKIRKDKIIPADIVYSRPGYLKEVRDLTPNGKIWTHISGTDLVRTGNGEFFVLEDNLRNPSGVSYVLENREIMKHIFPEAFESLAPRSVSSYPQKLRLAMQSFSKRKNPVLALLTPGPGNETFFEHSFLASYLGLTLVRPNDLTVRNGKLYLQTVAGLSQIHVLFRRLEDAQMDSLELKSGSLAGIPGLLEAVRMKNVAIVNPVGSGLLENRAIFSFMEEFAEFFFRESLILPQVETLWMGNPRNLQHATENIDDFIFKEKERSFSDISYFGSALSAPKRETLSKVLGSKPEFFVSQKFEESSLFPVLEGGFREANGILRTFTAMTLTGFQVMPGGLVRISPTSDPVNYQFLGSPEQRPVDSGDRKRKADFSAR